jgi:hypothetical protein
MYNYINSNQVATYDGDTSRELRSGKFIPWIIIAQCLIVIIEIRETASVILTNFVLTISKFSFSLSLDVLYFRTLYMHLSFLVKSLGAGN